MRDRDGMGIPIRVGAKTTMAFGTLLVSRLVALSAVRIRTCVGSGDACVLRVAIGVRDARVLRVAIGACRFRRTEDTGGLLTGRESE